MKSLDIIILAGGSGTRLWPLSKSNSPKQFLGFSNDLTLVQQTWERSQQLNPQNITIVTHQNHFQEVKRQLGALTTNPQVLSEPFAKNTLPAIAWAVAQIQDPEAIVAVFPADHHIQKTNHFTSDIEKAAQLARNGYFVTLGITPHYPETGYGYIEAGENLSKGRLVKKFTEKPDLNTAQEYTKSGNYFWNSGIFIFRVSDFQKELKRQEPEIFESIQKIIGSGNNPEVIQKEYAALKSISIDYGLIEKMVQKIAMLPASFSWNDLGGWASVYDVLPKHNDGNAVEGDVVSVDTHNSLLISKKGTLATVGLQDMVVVQTEDSVLVCPKDRSQDVKKIVDILKEKKHPVADDHLTVRRPWGTYTVLEEGPYYKIKKIVVDPGNKLSLQMHKHRAEHWVVVEGQAEVHTDNKVYTLQANESTYISPGTKHRLANPFSTPLSIIEVQTGSYVGEDDIERFEDIYGRK